MYKEFGEAEYRSLSLEELEERRSLIGDLAENPETSSETVDAILRESQICKAEFDRRNQLAELRSASITHVAAMDKPPVVASSSAAPAVSDIYDTDEYRNAFMDYFIRGTEMPVEYRSDQTTLTGDVPVMIPTTLSNRIIEEMEKYGQIWPLVTKLNVKGGIEFPVIDLNPVATWIDEDEVSEYQKVNANLKVSFLYYELECRIAQSILAAEVTFSAFQAKIAPAIAKAMVKALEQAIIGGNGVGKFLGIKKDTRITNVRELSASEITDWKNWHSKIKKYIPTSYRNGSFIMSRSTWEGYIETLADNGNAPVSNYNPVTGKEEPRLVGMPVILVEDDILPDFATANAGEVFAIYGRLQDYAVNSNMQINSVKWIDHDTNKVKNKSLLIADGKVLDPYGFMLIRKAAGSTDPDVTLTVPAGSTSLYGKTAADIQSNVTLTENIVNGELKYIDSWPAAGFDPAKGKNFLALHAQCSANHTMTCECIPNQGASTGSFTNDDVVMQVTRNTTGIRFKIYDSSSVLKVTKDIELAAILRRS